MITFVDKFQYHLPGQTLGEQQMKEMDNEGIAYLFSQARKVVNQVDCMSEVTVVFRGTSTRNVQAGIQGYDPDVRKVYMALERWFRENSLSS